MYCIVKDSFFGLNTLAGCVHPSKEKVEALILLRSEHAGTTYT